MSSRVYEMAQAFRQLEVLFNAGVQLAPSLASVSRGGWSPLVSEGLQQVEADLHRGATLSASLGRQPHLVEPTAVGLVKVGERTGRLHESLRLVSELLERQVKMRARLRAALTYPLFVAGAAALGLVGMLAFFLPRVAALALPVRGLPGWLTSLLHLLELASNPWLLAAGLETVLGVGALAWFWSRTETGRGLVDRALLDVPVLGRLLRLAGQARLCHTLGLSLGCGAPLLDALEMAPASVGNRELAAAVRRVTRRLLETGENLADCFRQEPYFDATFLALLAVGEESGRLEAMLRRLAALFEEDFELRVDSLTALLEPLLLGAMGAVVALGILMIFIPMAQMAQL